MRQRKKKRFRRGGRERGNEKIKRENEEIKGENEKIKGDNEGRDFNKEE